VVLVKMMNEAVPKGGTAEAGRDCAHKQMEEQLLDGTVNFLSVHDEKRESLCVGEGHLHQNVILLLDGGLGLGGSTLGLGRSGGRGSVARGPEGSRGSDRTLVLFVQRLGLDEAVLHGLENHRVLLQQLLDEFLGGDHLGFGLEDDSVVQRSQERFVDGRVLHEKLGEEIAVGLQLSPPAAVLGRRHVGLELP